MYIYIDIDIDIYNFCTEGICEISLCRLNFLKVFT